MTNLLYLDEQLFSSPSTPVLLRLESGSADLNPLAVGHAPLSAGPKSLEKQIKSEQDRDRDVLLIFTFTQYVIQLFYLNSSNETST